MVEVDEENIVATARFVLRPARSIFDVLSARLIVQGITALGNSRICSPSLAHSTVVSSPSGVHFGSPASVAHSISVFLGSL